MIRRACNHDTRSTLSRRALLNAGAMGLAASLAPGCKVAQAGQRGDARRLLIKGGTVLSLDPDVGDLMPGDVLISAGRIEAVAPALDVPDAEVVDASGMIVMPGFVDSHRHLWEGLSRNSGPDDLLSDYGTRILLGYGSVITPSEVYLGNLLSALAALNAGITTLLDWSHIGTSREHTDAAIDALRRSGMRAVYGYGPSFADTPPWFQNPDSPYPNDIYRLRRDYFNSPDQLLTLALAATGPEFVPLDAATLEFATARDVGARITVHIGTGTPGQSGALQGFSSAVALGEDTTYVHACTLSDAEWRLISDSGGTVSLAVPIELQMGLGISAIQHALDVGIRPSLSVDVEVAQPGDMFTQMRSCFMLQRGLANQAHLYPDTSHRAQLLTARDVLEFATVEGARANGLLGKTGTLTPGKEADVILLQTRTINVAPINDPTAAVVLGMDTSNVDTVFVAGRAVKWRGQLVGVDVPTLLSQAEAARAELLERAARR